MASPKDSKQDSKKDPKDEVIRNLQAEVSRMNNKINTLICERDQLSNDKRDAEDKLRKIEEAKAAEAVLVTTVKKAEELVAHVQDPTLRQTAYAFALQHFQAAADPNRRMPFHLMPFFLG